MALEIQPCQFVCRRQASLTDGGRHEKRGIIGYLKGEASTVCQLSLPLPHTREPFNGKNRGDFHGLLRLEMAETTFLHCYSLGTWCPHSSLQSISKCQHVASVNSKSPRERCPLLGSFRSEPALTAWCRPP